MPPSDLHVVLGATGGTGAAIVDELLARGHAVRAVSRHPGPDRPGVEWLAADVAEPDEAREVLEGAAVVYHAVNPEYHRWLAEFPRFQAAILDAATAAGAKLVFADNLYMYGPGAGEMREDTPQRATDRKGRLRIALAQELLDAHAAGRLRVAIGRSSDYFGPGGRNSALGESLFQAAIKGDAVRWLGGLDTPHSVSYLPDMARALVTLGERDEADGQVWHLPATTTTGRAFTDLLGSAVGRAMKVQPTSSFMLRIAGILSPTIREVAGVAYQWEKPFVVSDARFQAAFGPQAPTALVEAVGATVAWFREQGAEA